MKKILASLAVVALLSACSAAPAPTEDISPDASLVSYTIDSFDFGYTPATIEARVGDTVEIILTNSDGFHDIVIDEFSVASERITRGGETRVRFVADRAGTFTFYCAVGDHRMQGMEGTLVVHDEPLS